MAENLRSRYFFEVKRQVSTLDQQRNQPLIFARPGFIGDALGNITTYLGIALPTYYIVVRDQDGNLSVAYNTRVPNVANTPILIGYDPLDPTLYQVLNQRGSFAQQPLVNVPPHAPTHEWPNYDAVFLEHQQFKPALVMGNGAMTIVTYPFAMTLTDGTRKYVGQFTFNLVSYVPTIGSRWVLVCCSQVDGSMSIQPQAIQSYGISTLITKPIPAPAANTVPLAAVMCYAGQTAIIQSATQDNIMDLRGWVGGGGGISSALQFSDAIPLPAGVGNGGADTLPSRDDHVHPMVDLTDLLGRLALAGKYNYTFSANVDDWASANNDREAFVRIAFGGGSGWYLGGVTGGYAGRVLVIVNGDTTFSLTIKHNAGTSAAANRFLLPGAADIVIVPNQLAVAFYDDTSTCWRIVTNALGGAGTGDMLKAVYDTANRGYVDRAVTTDQIRGKNIDPALAPVASHTLQWDGTKYIDAAGSIGHFEDLSGQVTGATAHFTTANVFISGSLEVYDNGVRQNNTLITEDVGLNGFTLTYNPPLGHTLIVNYATAAGTPATITQRSTEGDMYMWAELNGLF